MAVGGYDHGMWRQPPHRRRRLVALAVAALAALALAGSAVGSTFGADCADAVLDEWTEGTLDSSYSPDCYEAAIDALPEDLRAYTTAADDIARAAITASRTVQSSRQLAAPPAASDPRAFPAEVALLLSLLAALAASGVTASLIRRKRSR
jgi:hypothetical protein